MTNSNATTHNREYIAQLDDCVKDIERRRRSGLDTIYPLVLSFETNRLFAQIRKGEKTKQKMTRIQKAYFASLIDKTGSGGSQDWLYNYENNIKDKKEFQGTREAFFEALEVAIPYLSEVEFNRLELEMEALVRIEEGSVSRKLYSNMSDGLKAMINVVSEICYRCIELNGFLGDQVMKMTPGIVMIDEIDMHLHPKWQRHVLQDLRNAFPQIQFIVTSHSPFIIQSVKSDELISFDANLTATHDPYAQGLEDIAENNMGMWDQIRSIHYNNMLQTAKDYYKLLKNDPAGKIVDIKQRLDELEERFYDDPAYVALLRVEREINQKNRNEAN
jgi:predicted ATP-binding protein involved in virulence